MCQLTRRTSAKRERHLSRIVWKHECKVSIPFFDQIQWSKVIKTRFDRQIILSFKFLVYSYKFASSIVELKNQRKNIQQHMERMYNVSQKIKLEALNHAPQDLKANI